MRGLGVREMDGHGHEYIYIWRRLNVRIRSKRSIGTREALEQEALKVSESVGVAFQTCAVRPASQKKATRESK